MRRRGSSAGSGADAGADSGSDSGTGLIGRLLRSLLRLVQPPRVDLPLAGLGIAGLGGLDVALHAVRERAPGCGPRRPRRAGLRPPSRCRGRASSARRASGRSPPAAARPRPGRSRPRRSARARSRVAPCRQTLWAHRRPTSSRAARGMLAARAAGVAYHSGRAPLPCRSGSPRRSCASAVSLGPGRAAAPAAGPRAARRPRRRPTLRLRLPGRSARTPGRHPAGVIYAPPPPSSTATCRPRPGRRCTRPEPVHAPRYSLWLGGRLGPAALRRRRVLQPEHGQRRADGRLRHQRPGPRGRRRRPHLEALHPVPRAGARPRGPGQPLPGRRTRPPRARRFSAWASASSRATSTPSSFASDLSFGFRKFQVHQRRQHVDRVGLRVPAPRARRRHPVHRLLHHLADDHALGRDIDQHQRRRRLRAQPVRRADGHARRT